MSNLSQFHTLKGYQQISSNPLSPAMEDYLEMIYRLLLSQPCVRINELAAQLNVKPSSCTKYIQLLTNSGYLFYKKYGYITLTENGLAASKFLYQRHNILHNFFCTINHSEQELELVEKVEHFIDFNTLNNMEKLTEYLHKMNY